ncbi:MAG: shikimate kinase [Planctomycetes bacterium]|nr:shikimate kinase [Planctomycetota bacterium]
MSTGSQNSPPSLFLIGYRATGKSTVGLLLAERLSWRFADTDALIEEALGITIAQCFAQRGESFFRERESESLEKVVQRIASGDKLVVATGGGIILKPENVALMRGAGKVVWLQASPRTIRERLEKDPKTFTTRPGLTEASPVREVEKVLSRRERIYRQSADLELRTDDGRPPEAQVEEIIRWLRAIPKTAESQP